MTPAPFVVGIAGWKNSGKTTLVTRLVEELVRRGFRVSTIKHSHHDIAFEAETTDSARHRQAGAHEVAVMGPQRWVLLHEHRNAPEETLEDILSRLAPADIVLVEGMKTAPIPKIEVRGAPGGGPPLAANDPLVFAVAGDGNPTEQAVPAFPRDDIEGLARVLLAKAGLPNRMEHP